MDSRRYSKQRLTVALVLLCVCCQGCLNLISKDRVRSKEATLKADLYSMRLAIDQYTQDKNKAPQDLNDLVHAGYLRAIPNDPFTDSSETWRLIQEDVLRSPGQKAPGVTDVHSGSDRISTEGTPYSRW